MPFLGGLANETLLQIIKETSAGDIAALASCCKQLHLLAQGRLAYHREKRATIEDVVVGYDMWETSAIHPSKHLQDILEDDDIRFYTRVMRIGSLEYGDPEDDGEEGPHEQAKAVLLANIESRYGLQVSAIVTKAYNALLPYVAKTDVDWWIESVIVGEEPAVVILLLAFYPNLEILYIYEPGQTWWKNRKWGNLFRSLTKTAMDPATNTLSIFNRLSEFRLTGVGDDGGMEADALMLTPFMALPTMRKIVGSVVDGRNLHWSYGTGASKVTALDLEGDIDTTSLSHLIRGLKTLEHFRYEFSSAVAWSGKACYAGNDLNRLKWGPRSNKDAAYQELDEGYADDDDPDEDYSDECPSGFDEVDRPKWEPCALTARLLQYARDSLVSLDLSAAGFKGAVKFDSDEPFIGSLRSFRALRVVRLDTMMLFKEVKCFSNVSLLGGNSTQQTSLKEIRAHRLVNFLPVTIYCLEMTSKYVGRGLSKNDVAALFTGLPELRDLLPDLFDITVIQKTDHWQSDKEKEGWEELHVRCEENDIELTLEEE